MTAVLVSWQFWLQMSALVFVAGGAWVQLRALARAVSDLARTVQADHDVLLELKGTVLATGDTARAERNSLDRRVTRLESKLFNGGSK